MALDFNKVNDEQVGYELYSKPNPTRSSSLPTVYALRALKFRDFIPPYTHNATNYWEVCRHLTDTLTSLIEQQDSVLDGKRSVFLEVLASSTLQREAIHNSLQLIRSNYHCEN